MTRTTTWVFLVKQIKNDLGKPREWVFFLFWITARPSKWVFFLILVEFYFIKPIIFSIKNSILGLKIGINGKIYNYLAEICLEVAAYGELAGCPVGRRCGWRVL